MESEASAELWPLRPRPYDGELFSSWLVRVARCYEMPVEMFCRAVWPAQRVWCRDIDRQIDDEKLQLLSRKTGVAYPELFLMTLRSHEQYACVLASADSARDLYFRSGGTDHAIRFCPYCLAGPRPYYRLEWRLAFVTACPEHRRPLLEKCDYCKAPCLFANIDVDWPFGSCSRCHRPLSAMGKPIDKELALQLELHIEFQQTLVREGRRNA